LLFEPFVFVALFFVWAKHNAFEIAGTVVDYGICDPWGFDFYLSSHASEVYRI
jgi:hypothetical protein